MQRLRRARTKSSRDRTRLAPSHPQPRSTARACMSAVKCGIVFSIVSYASASVVPSAAMNASREGAKLSAACARVRRGLTHPRHT